MSVSARRNRPGVCGGSSVLLLCNHRMQSPDADSLRVRLQATVSCSQSEYSGLLMSRQTVELVCIGAVVSSSCAPLGSLTVAGQGFGFLVSGGGRRLRLFAPRLSQVICFFIA